MGGGGDRSGDGDVGERREVVQRQALGVQQRRQLAVPDAALDGDRPGRTVDRHDTVEGGHRDHVAVGVGDMAEAVPAAGGMHAPTVGPRAAVTICWTCATVDGRWMRSAAKVRFPAQLRVVVNISVVVHRRSPYDERRTRAGTRRRAPVRRRMPTRERSTNRRVSRRSRRRARRGWLPDGRAWPLPSLPPPLRFQRRRPGC